MGKMTILPHLPTRQSTNNERAHKSWQYWAGEFGKYGENDNFGTFTNKAKHKAMRGPIKVGNTAKFGKYGENDNFAAFANKAKHKQ